MPFDAFPLGHFEVDCDGSACGSPGSRHVHPPQLGFSALARVIYRDGKRTGYEPAAGITRLEMGE